MTAPQTVDRSQVKRALIFLAGVAVIVLGAVVLITYTLAKPEDFMCWALIAAGIGLVLVAVP